MKLQSKLLTTIGVEHAFQSADEPQGADFHKLNQVHSATVFELGNSTTQEELNHFKGDGLLTRVKKKVAVQTADCLPCLFASENGKAVAAVHAGWRGLEQKILLHTLESFKTYGIDAAHLTVAIGPAIEPCCFEVNSEVAEKFKPYRQTFTAQPKPRAATRNVAPVSENNLWVDLKKVAMMQLMGAGVPVSRIELVGACTYCGPAEFASYRRGTHEGVKAGRQWSWVAPKH